MGLLARGDTVNDQTSQRRADPGHTLSLYLHIYACQRPDLAKASRPRTYALSLYIYVYIYIYIYI